MSRRGFDHAFAAWWRHERWARERRYQGHFSLADDFQKVAWKWRARAERIFTKRGLQ